MNAKRLKFVSLSLMLALAMLAALPGLFFQFYQQMPPPAINWQSNVAATDTLDMPTTGTSSSQNTALVITWTITSTPQSCNIIGEVFETFIRVQYNHKRGGCSLNEILDALEKMAIKALRKGISVETIREFINEAGPKIAEDLSMADELKNAFLLGMQAILK